MILSEAATTLWDTAKALALQVAPVSPSARPALPPLLFFTDPDRTPEPWRTAENLPRGAGVVFRAFAAEDAVEQGLKLRAACDRAGVVLLAGRDVELAEAIRADGLHLPERLLGRAGSVRADHPDWLVTGAVHQAENWRLAKSLDAAIVSPVFPAGGASAAKAALRLDGFQALTEQAPCPVYALGGISPGNAHSLLQTRACGFAAVDAITAAFG